MLTYPVKVLQIFWMGSVVSMLICSIHEQNSLAVCKATICGRYAWWLTHLLFRSFQIHHSPVASIERPFFSRSSNHLLFHSKSWVRGSSLKWSCPWRSVQTFPEKEHCRNKWLAASILDSHKGQLLLPCHPHLTRFIFMRIFSRRLR